MTHVIDDLLARNLIAHSTDLDALRDEMSAGPITFYVGFDPTAPSIHVGNLLQLITARRLQLAGHKPLLLVGGSTGLIGDPKQSGERVMNSKETVATWVERIASQVSKFVSFEGDNAARIVNNLDWTGPMSVVDFLRDIGKHFPINRMLARDVVASRLESGISYTEFSYILLQSMDFLELNRRYGAVLQTGGSDQWGNLTGGVELIRRADGNKAHAFATPLITKADGTKFGKTETGTIWLDPSMMSPYAFYQRWIQAEDEMVGEYLKQFTFVPLDEIEALMAEHNERPGARIAQRRLAGELTTFVHGESELSAAIAASQALFGQAELDQVPAETIAAALRETGAVDVQQGTSLVDSLVACGLVNSKSNARRAIADGGAYVNNERASEPDMVLTSMHTIAGEWVVLRKGKRGVSGIRLT